MDRYRVTMTGAFVVELLAVSHKDARDAAQEELQRCIETTGKELLATSPERIDFVEYRFDGDVFVANLTPPPPRKRRP